MQSCPWNLKEHMSLVGIAFITKEKITRHNKVSVYKHSRTNSSVRFNSKEEMLNRLRLTLVEDNDDMIYETAKQLESSWVWEKREWEKDGLWTERTNVLSRSDHFHLTKWSLQFVRGLRIAITNNRKGFFVRDRLEFETESNRVMYCKVLSVFDLILKYLIIVFILDSNWRLKRTYFKCWTQIDECNCAYQYLYTFIMHIFVK